MSPPVESAIAKIKSIGDHICWNQVYCFDEYNPETGDATALCQRLGIPVTDDIVVEFQAKRTFSALPKAEIAEFENRLGAALPHEYKRLLLEFGTFHLPGSAQIFFNSPDAALSRTCDAWGFDNPKTMPVLSISSYHHDCDGDSIGFRRHGASFGSELYVFKHELRYLHGDDDNVQAWTEKIAGSLPDFIITYIDSLD